METKRVKIEIDELLYGELVQEATSTGISLPAVIIAHLLDYRTIMREFAARLILASYSTNKERDILYGFIERLVDTGSITNKERDTLHKFTTRFITAGGILNQEKVT